MRRFLLKDPTRKSFTLHYGSILLTYWGSYAVLSAFASFYLLESGFSNTVVGLVTALGSVIASFTQPVLASRADRESAPPLRKIIFAVALVMLALILVLLVSGSSVPALCLIAYVLCLVLLNTALPLLNALGMETVHQGKKFSYGLSRAIGSLGYAGVALAMGWVTVRYGALSVPACAGLFTVLFALLTVRYPLVRAERSEVEPGSQSQRPVPLFSFCARYPKLMLFLAGMVLVYVSHSLLNIYTLQIIRTKGGDNVSMGLCTALAVVFEIIPMIFYAWFSKVFRLDTLLKISGVSYFLKILFSLLARDVLSYYLVQVFQLSAWGFSTLFLVVYISRVVERQDAVKGQAFATTALTVGNAIGSLLGGRLLDLYGVPPMLTVGTVLAGAGALMMLFFCQKTKKQIR